MKKALRIAALVAVLVVLGAAIANSMVKPSRSSKVWNKEMPVGKEDGKNFFIIYSDLVCPYCVAFENAIVDHEEEFKQYLEENDILLEVRMSEFLYEYGETRPINSRYSAEATYCAKNEGKFWEYYNKAIKTVWTDYFEGSGKSAAESMRSLGKDYWIGIGKEVGLGESFEKCVREDESLDEVKKNTEKTAKMVNGGMPYFKFNEFATSGFDLSWGWEYVLYYFEAGLESV